MTTGDTHGTTISVGFRAPNYKSVVTALWEEISSFHLPDEKAFYKDGTDLLKVPLSPGSISHQAINSIKTEIQSKVLVPNDTKIPTFSTEFLSVISLVLVEAERSQIF